MWTRAHLEDLLFQPENDHLLFAYFGISLGAKRHSRLARVRSQLATKRKLMRALSVDAIDQTLSGKYALIRDIDDQAYLAREDVPEFADDPCPPWHPVQIEAIAPQGLVVERFAFDGWLKADGTWDIAPGTRELPYLFDPRQWFDDEEYAAWAEAHIDALNVIPEGEHRHIRVLSLIPFTSILEVDPIGDAKNSGIHVYCCFDSDVGPYTHLRNGSTEHYVATTPGLTDEVALDTANRGDLFATAAETAEIPRP